MGFLAETVARVRRELRDRPLDDGKLLLRTRTARRPVDLEAALRRDGVGLVGEFRRRSPGGETFAASNASLDEPDAGGQAARYEAGGARAISVLTDPHQFGGSLVDLRSVRRKTSLPVMRRDFIVHPSQVIEARAEGADAIALIAAALSVAELDELIAAARD